MMKCNIKICLLGSVLIVMLGACKKLLKQDIIQTATTENAWTGPADARIEVAAAYALLRDAIMSGGGCNYTFTAGDVRAGEFTNGSVGYGTYNLNTKAALGGLTDWAPFYKAIAQYHLILEKVETIPVEKWDVAEKERYIAETRFLRGFTFFFMSRMWREFPVTTKAVDLEIRPREKEAKIFEIIYSDLNYASEHLKWVYNGDEKAVRATKGAALAFLAHAKAWMHDYAAAEKYADSVIRFGGYSLLQDSATLGNIFIGKSAEGIFEINFSYDQKELNYNATPAGRTMYAPYYFTQGSNSANPDADSWVLFPAAATKQALFPDNKRDIRKWTWFLQNKWTRDRAWLGKYRYLKAGADTTSNNINECNTIITRLADILLLRAEALAELNRNGEAALLLNQVRDRAKAPQYLGGGQIRDSILAERRIELLAEGHRFFDLVRTRQLPKFLPAVTQADWFNANVWTVPMNDPYVVQSNYTQVQYPVWQ